jgi:cytochrome c oxidase subunit III
VVTETHGTSAHAADAHAEHSLLHHHFDDLDQQRECNSLAMWSFLATEAMMFGGLFFAYSLYRFLYPGAFWVGSHHLNITLGTLNTFVLLFSSLTMALAVHAASVRNRRRLITCLVLTWILGAAFIGIKGVEWTADYHEGLVPAIGGWHYYDEPGSAAELVEHHTNPHQVMMYFVVYFCMTGLHAIHMVAGLILVGMFIWLGSKGKFTNGNDQPVEIAGLYWHFVDIIWVFLFPLLYLIAGFHPGGR